MSASRNTTTVAADANNVNPAPDTETAPVTQEDIQLLLGADKAYPSPGDPTSVARRILDDLYRYDGKLTLRHWRGDWYRWTRTHWEIISDDELAAEVWLHLDAQKYESGEEMKPWRPTGAKTLDVRRALQFLTHLADDREAPMWTDRSRDDRDPKNIISMANGLLHWPDRTLLPHSPELFNTYALPFEYQPDADCPLWLRTVDHTFQNDNKGAMALQEFFGYALSGDTSRQKGLMLVGPPGGGKGTVTNVLTALMGQENVSSTDPRSMSGEFGLWPLIGKPLALLADARTDGPVTADALGKLLRIIGGDPVDANRKGKSFWSGYLPTRFIWVSNEQPRFVDNSGAIIRRWIMIRLNTSVPEHMRDENLGTKLKAELPGILNWALEGLAELNKQGHFTEPETQSEMKETMQESVSPVSAFLNDHYKVTGNEEDILPLADVYVAYRAWAENSGHSPTTQSVLHERIKGCPDPVDSKNTSVNGAPKARLVFGIRR